jgi:hypothetical protein
LIEGEKSARVYFHSMKKVPRQLGFSVIGADLSIDALLFS